MKVLDSIKNEVIKIMDNDPAHDFEHVMRVYNNAQKIVKKEKANPKLVLSAVLLHDIVSYPKSGKRSKFSSIDSAKKSKIILKKYGYLIASFLFGATPLPSNILFITYGLMRAKSVGIYVGFWIGRTISYIIMIYFGNTVLTPFLEIFEDRLTGILLIDGIGIGLIVLFACINWTVLLTQRKIKFVKPKIWRF